MKKFLLIVTLLLQFLVVGAYAQQTIKGKVIDSLTNESLPGASVNVKGTKIIVLTDSDGSFTINGQDGANVLLITFVGYNTKEVKLSGKNQDLGEIQLSPSSNAMSEVTIIGSNIAIDRKTPVAVSTVGKQFIEEKAGSQEFPELLKSTPGIQVTKTGGGFGDARASIRGFKSANIAVMINGVPINDMENGSVYWSNWAGLSDVTSSMQVQRGLGASRLVVPSLGGTINIITKTTDVEKGGSFSQSIGASGYLKTALSISTGMNEKGWAFSASGSKTTGDGFAEGLEFNGYNYFMNISKKFNDKHTLSLTGMGATQYHGQRSTKQSIAMFEGAPQGKDFNFDWGVKDGKVVHVRDNFYSKPVISLNDYWAINETSQLSTVLYASAGTGGGGNVNTPITVRTGNKYSPYDLDAVVDQNAANPDGSAINYLRAARNDHQWIGALSTYKKKVNDHFDFLGGLDLRYYKGIHFTEVTDLLGGDYAKDPFTGAGSSGDANNPNKRALVGDKVAYNYNSNVIWEGAFTQLEYSKNNLSAFVSLSGSNTSYRRTDFYSYLSTDPKRQSEYLNFLGYQAKAGANYNISKAHNIFANVGYLERAPTLTAVFLNYRNDVNEDAVTEKLLSYELGYGFRSKILTANINLYRSSYNDKSYTRTQTDPVTGTSIIANLTGVDEMHQGVEIDFKLKPVKQLTFTGSLSVGDWKYSNDVGPVTIYNETQQPIGTINKMFLNGQKVGDQAQTSAALGLDLEIIPGVKIGSDFNYYSNYIADFNFYSISKEGMKPWKVPNYSLLDLNASINFKIAGLKSAFYMNVNNVLDTEYISDAYDASGLGTAAGSAVFYGIGRTITTTLKINF